MHSLATVVVLMALFLNGSEGGELTTLTSCICPGYEAVFECVVTGDEAFATIWSGTALDHCPNGRITLRHSRFNQSGYSLNQTCGDSGPIISRAVSVVNDSYSSQLIVNVSHSLLGANVECASDRGSHVGIKQIPLTTAPLPPPSNVTLSLINSSHLTFTWNSVSPNCQALHYKINATNCGQCPNTADTNSVTCSIPKNITTEQACVLSVENVVCGNVSSIPSDPIMFVMKVPNAPRINVTSAYLGETKKLTKISAQLTTSELNLYNGTDISYTIDYTDITTGNTCGSITLPASSCDDGVCTSMLEVSSSLCPPQADISVSAFATNIFGNGHLSDHVHIAAVNHFVEIDFDFITTNAIKCTFLNQRLGTQKSCVIEYGHKVETQCGESQLSLSSKGNLIMSRSDIVNINLHPLTGYGIEYCYKLTASDGITTVIVNGTFAACSPDGLSNGESARDDIVCGASYTALGIENGFVCYSGTKVGSTAVHYCYDCGFNSIKGSVRSVIRTCGWNGQWNGSIPHCECSQFSASDLAPFIGAIGGIVALILLVIIMILAIIIIILCKAKTRLNKQLQQDKDLENKIYEEIGPMPQQKMDTENNVAYASCHSIMQSVSCAYQFN